MRFLANHLFFVMVGGPLHSANGNRNNSAVNLAMPIDQFGEAIMNATLPFDSWGTSPPYTQKFAYPGIWIGGPKIQSGGPFIQGAYFFYFFLVVR